MIQWVDDLCASWGAHKRWVYADIIEPMPSMMGKIVEEGKYAASQTRSTQRYKEVFSRDSLAVSRAIVGIRPELMATLVVQYIYLAPLKRRPSMVGELHGQPISLRTYWRRIHSAHCFIATRIELDQMPVAQNGTTFLCASGT